MPKNPTNYMPLLVILVCASGCQSTRHSSDSRFEQIASDYDLAQTQELSTESIVPPPEAELSGPHNVEDYLKVGLAQNPEIQEMRFLVESLSYRVPQAGSLPDPMLGLTAYPSPVQTASGQQEFALAMNQKIPWRGKLEMRSAVAEQDVIAARAKLAEVELKVAEKIRTAYYQLYFLQQAISIIDNDREKLKLIEQTVEEVYKVKRSVSQQDVLQVQVALSRLESELIAFNRQKEITQAILSRLLHISPKTSPEAMKQVPSGQLDSDFERYYEWAIQSNPALHSQLAKIEKDRFSASLANLENYPDFTFGFNWIGTSSNGVSPVANGDDAFLLTLGMNLPTYRKRIDAGVREAQTRALSNVEKYERLKDEATEGVAILLAKIKSQNENLQLFRNDIIPKQQLTLDQSINDYQVGKVDFLQMIDNWRQLLRFHIAEKRFESELQQSIASLARQIGMFELPIETADAAAE